MVSYVPVNLAFHCEEPVGCQNDKAPIIFTHGITASKEYWNDIPKIVADATKRKVYAVDARNHGDSEWNDIFDFDVNVCDLLNFMDSINAPKAILVGHSMGGVTAMKVALQKPERVEKLIVEDMNVRQPPKFILDMLMLYLNLAQAAVQQVPPTVDEQSAKKIISDFIYNGLPPAIQKMTRQNTVDYRILLKRTSDGRYTFKANLNAIVNALKTASNLMTEHKGVFEGPAAFIYGMESPFKVGNDEPHIKQYFPNSQLLGISNATHTVHTDCPQEFTEVLLKCLEI